MSFQNYLKGTLAGWLWYATLAIVTYASTIQMANKQTNLWQNKKGGLAGWLLYAIIVIILIIVLILVLRFLFNII